MKNDRDIQTITDQSALQSFCDRLARSPYVTVDTEFIRDRTYWPRLCLIQAASDEDAGIIDPLAPGIDLQPFLDLLSNEKVLKVFHAARQDVEIFVHLSNAVPHPIFDTQVAAMVCGFGDSVGYDRLVEKIAKERIDKASRFTDWARRPLNQKQLRYAISDVTHLRPVYKWLAAELEREGRASWLDEEMATLTDPATYRTDPEEAWQRLKFRSRNKRYLAVLKEVAAWRELEAQSRDLPRNHVLKDEAIQEVAAERPESVDGLKQLRSISKGLAEGKMGQGLLTAIARGLTIPDNQIPDPALQGPPARGLSATVDLLKVLLKFKSEEHDVAAKMIATVAELEKLAADDNADVPALRGWRRQIFGDDALDLKNGRLAISVRRGKLHLQETGGGRKN
jgi:ribonuclease D